MIWRDVTNCPSRPDMGDVLTPKIIDTVGSSIAIGGIAMRCSTSAIGLADRDVLDARKADDVAGRRVVDVDAPEPVEGEELRDFRVVERSIELADGDRVADFHASVEDAADGNPPEVVARIEVRDERSAAAPSAIAARRRHVLDDGVEERTEVRSCSRGFDRLDVPARALA